MEDTLTRAGIAVENRSISSISVPMLAREGGGAPEHLADQLIVGVGEIVERWDVSARHDEHVHWRLGIDVPDGYEALVPVNECRRDLSLGDFAEQAIGHVTSWSRLRSRAGAPCAPLLCGNENGP